VGQRDLMRSYVCVGWGAGIMRGIRSTQPQVLCAEQSKLFITYDHVAPYTCAQHWPAP